MSKGLKEVRVSLLGSEHSRCKWPDSTLSFSVAETEFRRQ